MSIALFNSRQVLQSADNLPILYSTLFKQSHSMRVNLGIVKGLATMIVAQVEVDNPA